jgi:hypothetical protein
VEEEIIDMFNTGKKQIKDDNRNSAIKMINDVAESYDLEGMEVLKFYEDQMAQGNKYFWYIKPKKQKGGKVVAEIKETSPGEYIVNEVINAIESMVQSWLGNAAHTCKVDRSEYFTIIEKAIEKKIDKETLKDSWINGRTNEFKLFDNGTIEVVDRVNTEKLINELLSDYTWLKLETDVFKYYKTGKLFLIRKLIIDDFICEDNKPKEAMKYGIMNWFAEKHIIRQKIIDAYKQRNCNLSLEKCLRNKKLK